MSAIALLESGQDVLGLGVKIEKESCDTRGRQHEEGMYIQLRVAKDGDLC